jgi:hypothetical protein
MGTRQTVEPSNQHQELVCVEVNSIGLRSASIPVHARAPPIANNVVDLKIASKGADCLQALVSRPGAALQQQMQLNTAHR